MKFLIAFACLLVVVLANEDAKVLHNEASVEHDSFKYDLELDNHVKAHQHGAFDEHHNWVVDGEYEYVSPEGEHIKLAYRADEHGYQPDPSSHLLPKAPPIPEAILKSLEYIRAHPDPESHEH